MTVSTPPNLQSLIERYERHRDHYRSPAYNETQLRVEFVDDLFIALGWDVRNEAGYADAYKDVVHEDAIKVGTATKAPDYAFRIGGVRKFFLETKKPSIDITSDPEPAWQLRRYAWSAKLPLGILTNFEHLVVYDTRVKPSQSDSASTARVMLIHYTELVDRWQEIEEIFSIESIRLGAFDKYAESTRSKRGTAEVDDAFLADLEHWRDQLARNIALRNIVTDSHGNAIPSDSTPVIPSEVEGSPPPPGPRRLTQRELNFAVQATIDRIIFLRICEDRGIEQYGRLQALANGTDIYPRLQELFRQADERYNSGLFHFHDERDRTGEPDRLTPSLQIDDRVLKDIFRNLYYPHSPYEFSALPADILGQVYERFLGSVIRLTPSGRAVVEEKPEVRKAGGVYYTPTYIVDYIVEHTVGKLLEGKTPRGAARLKILDPACGSGSFLIGAYQYLLDWHRDWYLADGSDKHTKVMYQGAGGEWRLTTAERRRILLNNIYGVDIDQQAVEVTKLSLLLKVLEGETEESLNQQLRFVYRERALPDLRDNIKCGNSLIGPDFYQTVQLGLAGFDEEERYRINVFDWEAEFPQIMRGKNPGFDAVIGNPPYGKSIDKNQQRYFSNRFMHQNYQKDLYLLFLERYEYLLKSNGKLGVIVSNTWLQSVSLEKIRRHLVSTYLWRRIMINLDRAFKAIVDTHVLIFEKPKERVAAYEQLTIELCERGSWRVSHELPTALVRDDGRPINVIYPVSVHQLVRRVEKRTQRLKEFLGVYNGIKPFETGKGTPPQTRAIVREKPFVHSGERPDENWSPLISGTYIGRYELRWRGNYWVQYGPWLAAPRDPAIFHAAQKIMVRQTGDSLIAALVGEGYIARNNVHILLSANYRDDLRYHLGLLNSKLLALTYYFLNPERGEALAEVKAWHIEQLPIRTIDFDDPADVERHDRMVSLVQQMLDLHQQLDAARTDQDKRHLQRLIDHTDREIDSLVYDLYDLTDEEIAIVEGEVG